MSTTEKRIVQFIQKNTLLEKNKRVLLALSGGPDSVLLFHFFLKYKGIWGAELFAAHVNHMLREDAAHDQEFCRHLCAENGITLFTESFNVTEIAHTKRESFEEAARNIRYDYFNRLATENNLDIIVTGHNLDDNTETVLFNLFKGTGLKGVAGIPLKRDNIIRPLLCIPKTEVLEYLQENGRKYCTDFTNEESNYDRNFIRNKIVPLIKENINPELNDAVFRFSLNIRDAAEKAAEKAEELSAEFIVYSDENTAINSDLFEYNDELVVYEVIRNVLTKLGLSRHTRNDILSVIELNSKNTGASVILAEGIQVIKNRSELVVTRNTQISDNEYEIKAGEEVYLEDFGIKIKIKKFKKGNIQFSPDYEIISADNLDDIFILRRWKSGDKFSPLGLKGLKKVSDFLTDSKVPANKKNNWPVLVNRNNIVCVVGLRIDDSVRLDNDTKEYFKIWTDVTK